MLKIIMMSTIQRILEGAINAPSGDNAQPWRFKVEGQTVHVFNVPDGDGTLYNFRQRGSYLAHGALVENIALMAEQAGFASVIEPFPGPVDCTARITLTPSSAHPVLLADAIEKRTTNRKPYDRRQLESAHRVALQSVRLEPGVTFQLAQGDEIVDHIAKTVSINERLLMENRTLHDFLFGMIRWSRSDERTRPGLYLKTMEFPLPVQFLFRTLFRFWPVIRALNHIGLSTTIPKQSAQGYRASSAFGAVVLRGESDTDFFNAGRVVERLWLTATQLGLSIQPVTAIPYLAQRVRAGEASAFNDRHKRYISDAYGALSTAFNLSGGEHIAMLFRVGYGPTPSAHSHKAAPVIL
jgi:nitroreductase